MKIQNAGIFTAHYICEHCGTALTIAPESFTLPRKDFDPND